MGHIEVKETVNRKIYFSPCIKCNSEDIDFGDCGYSSFNVAWGRCKKCKNEVKISPCGCDISKEEIIKVWNESNDPIKLKQKYEKQIEELQKLIDNLPIQNK